MSSFAGLSAGNLAQGGAQQSLSLVFNQRRQTRIGAVNMDASISKLHTKTADVTDHPVEDGIDITDHIRVRPDEYEIVGIVSQHPITLLASFRAKSPLEGDLTAVDNRPQLAYAELERVMNAGELITVVDEFKSYENMAITSLTVPIDAERGNIAEMTIKLRQIRIASTERVEQPTSTIRPNETNGGTRPPTPASAGEAAKSGSVLSDLGSALFGGS